MKCKCSPRNCHLILVTRLRSAKRHGRFPSGWRPERGQATWTISQLETWARASDMDDFPAGGPSEGKRRLEQCRNPSENSDHLPSLESIYFFKGKNWRWCVLFGLGINCMRIITHFWVKWRVEQERNQTLRPCRPIHDVKTHFWVTWRVERELNQTLRPCRPIHDVNTHFKWQQPTLTRAVSIFSALFSRSVHSTTTLL